MHYEEDAIKISGVKLQKLEVFNILTKCAFKCAYYKGVTNMLDSNIHAIRDDLKTLMKDAQLLFIEAAKVTGSKSEELQSKAMELLDRAITDAHHLKEIGAEKGKRIAQDTDTYVHEHPWHAIGIAAAAGALIGMLIGRR